MACLGQASTCRNILKQRKFIIFKVLSLRFRSSGSNFFRIIGNWLHYLPLVLAAATSFLEAFFPQFQVRVIIYEPLLQMLGKENLTVRLLHRFSQHFPVVLFPRAFSNIIQNKLLLFIFRQEEL